MDDTKIIKLAEARRDRTSVKDAMKMMVAAVTNLPEYKELEIDLQEAIETESEALEQVADTALAEFNDGERANIHPHPAITIKNYERCDILDENKAREWCFTNFRPALVLDTKVFVDAAKKKQVPEELVSVYSEYQATIAQDLSSYLKEKV